MNRTILTNGNTQVQDFITSSRKLNFGDFMELPMNAWGSVVKRFVVVGVTNCSDKVFYELVAA